MQYISPGPAEVEVKPHGNSHSTDPYLRSSKSTLQALKKALKGVPAKEAVEQVSKENGGEISAKSAGSLPRNRRQAYNISKHQKEQDPLYNLIVDSQTLKQDQFVREVKLSPEPSVIMAKDYQIADLDAFCTNPEHHCVFGVDPTFDLGHFNLTVTTYKQLQLVKANGESPTFVGPLFLHYRKTFSCYHSFASGLLGLNKNLSSIRAFGTDGETALIDAFSQQCQSAVHLTCFNHCRENIKRKLRELNVPPPVASECIFDIFGGQRGTTFVEGLADADSESDFDSKLAKFENVWNPQFFDYFLKNKASIFKESMIKPVRIKAGLGDPPDEYHNNAPECMNSVIKAKVDRNKRNTLDELCRHMKSLVEDQENHLIRAITRRGEYRLYPAFQKFEMSPLRWFELNEQVRLKHIQQLRNVARKYMTKLSVSKPSTSASWTDDQSSADPDSEETITGCASVTRSTPPSVPAVLTTPVETTITASEKNDRVVNWTLASQICKNTTIPSSSINSIWEKAEMLLSNSRAITPAPVEGEAKMVKSSAQPGRPHLVRIFKDGKLACDENCPMWVSLKICSHCVAVAHSIGCASDFSSWFCKNIKRPINLTKLTTQQIAQGVGKKPRNRYSHKKSTNSKLPITARVQPSTSAPIPQSTADQSVVYPSTQLSSTSRSYSSLDFLYASPGDSTSTLVPSGYSSPVSSGYSSTPVSSGYSSNYSSQPGPSGYSSTPFPPGYSSTPVSSGYSSNYSSQPGPSGYSSTPFPPGYSSTPVSSAYSSNYLPTQTPSGYLSTPLSFISTSTSAQTPFVLSPTGNYSSASLFTSSSGNLPPTQSRLIFWACKINKRITTCYGCRGKFMRGVDGSLPIPPLDLILRCTESREYYDKDGNKRQKDNSNTYYHTNVSCIQSKHKDFQLSDVQVEDSVRSTLLQSHFDLLKCVFNFQ